MKSVIRIGSAFVVVVGLAVASFAMTEARQEVDITGYYSEKDGEFTKITRTGEAYQYFNHQKVGDWVGVGIRHGDTLSIGWQRADGRNLGVSVYKIEKGEKGPALVGGWSSYPSTGIAKDTLIWSRRIE